MSIRKRLARLIYPKIFDDNKRLKDKDLKRLMRGIFNSIQVGDVAMDERTLLRRGTHAHLILKDKTMKEVRDSLLTLQKDYSVCRSVDWFDTIFSRGTINGISLFYEELEHLSNIYKDKLVSKQPKKFDKHDII